MSVSCKKNLIGFYQYHKPESTQVDMSFYVDLHFNVLNVTRTDFADAIDIASVYEVKFTLRQHRYVLVQSIIYV